MTGVSLKKLRSDRRGCSAFASLVFVFTVGSLSCGPAWAQVPLHGVREFTESGTFEVPAGVSQIIVELWGAGGGGGGGALAGVGMAPGGGGGGGGSGAYLRASVAVTPGESYLVTVGTGGQGGAGPSGNAPASGLDGGDSTIRRGGTAVLMARGGRGGRSATTFSGGMPGAGGEGTPAQWMLVRSGLTGYRGEGGTNDESDSTFGGRGAAFVAGTVAVRGSAGGAGGAGGLLGNPGKKGADGEPGYVVISW